MIIKSACDVEGGIGKESLIDLPESHFDAVVGFLEVLEVVVDHVVVFCAKTMREIGKAVGIVVPDVDSGVNKFVGGSHEYDSVDMFVGLNYGCCILCSDVDCSEKGTSLCLIMLSWPATTVVSRVPALTKLAEIATTNSCTVTCTRSHLDDDRAWNPIATRLISRPT